MVSNPSERCSATGAVQSALALAGAFLPDSPVPPEEPELPDADAGADLSAAGAAALPLSPADVAGASLVLGAGPPALPLLLASLRESLR